MTTHNTQEQDLRTALHKAVSKALHNNQFADGWPEMVDPVVDAVLALAAPPRPVDAERVEPHFGWIYHNPDEGWEWSAHHPVESGEVDDATEIKAATGPVLKDMLLAAWDDAEEARAELDNVREFDWRQTPTHSPDKAVTREGQTWPAGYQETFDAIGKAVTVHPNGMLGISVKAFYRALSYPDAPKPTGTEAGRGVETDALVDRFAVALKAKLRFSEAKHGWRDGWMRPDWQSDCQRDLAGHVAKGDPVDVAAYAAFCWHHGWSTAATPTPPVSPSPDSAGPAEAREALARHLAQEHVANTDAEDGYDWADTDDVWKRSFLAKADRALAALTPSAPIADPVREWEIVERMCRAFVGPAWGARAFQGAEHYRNRMRDVLAAIPAPATVSQVDAQTQEGGR